MSGVVAVFSSPVPGAARQRGAIQRAAVGLAAALITLLPSAGPGHAGWFDRDPEPATSQAEGSGHRGPKAYHAMCARDPGLCRHDRQAGISSKAGPAARMDKARWDQLLEVNDRLNDRIRGVTDQNNYGVSEHWALKA